MSETRSFQFALLVSLLSHSLLFVRLPDIPFFPSRRVLERLEITYFKIQEEPKPQKILKRSEAQIQTPSQVQAQAEKLPDIKKEEILEPKAKIAKTTPTPLEKLHKEKALKETEDDITKKPVYISYYRAIREKIKRRADAKFFNTRNFPAGEVLLSFVVASNGELLELMVIEEHSTENLFLKKAAAESIKEASPFAPFPEALNQSQITFNVIISFEMK